MHRARRIRLGPRRRAPHVVTRRAVGTTDRPPWWAAGILTNTAAALIARGLGQVFRLFAVLKVASYLGSYGYGIYGYLITSLEVFRVLASFGLDTAAVRAIAIAERPPSVIVHHLAAVKTVLAAIGCALLAALSFVLPGYAANRSLLLLLAPSLFPQGWTATLTARFQAEHSMVRLIPVQIVSGALYLAGVYILSARHAGLGAFIVLSVAFEYLAFGLTYAVARRLWQDRAHDASNAAIDARLARSLFRQAVPLGLLEVLAMAYARLGVFLLQHYHGYHAVGVYQAAVRYNDPLLQLGAVLAVSALPVMSRYAEQGRVADLTRVFYRYSAAFVALASCVALALSLGGARLLLRLIKPEYLDGTGAFVLLAWGAVCMLQNQLSTAVMNAFGKFHYTAIIAAWNLCVYVVLGWTLVPRLGPTGAGFATFATEALNAAVQLVVVATMLRRRDRCTSTRAK
jgi:O-antigen/teichoic acid export membrane protein